MPSFGTLLFGWQFIDDGLGLRLNKWNTNLRSFDAVIDIQPFIVGQCFIVPFNTCVIIDIWSIGRLAFLNM